MEIFNARRITSIGMVAAIYVVATLLCSGLAYGQVQFRVSEILMLLCFYNKDYIISMTLGCFISNLFSPLGFIDAGFGTAATLIAAVLMYLTRNKVNLAVSSLYPVVTNGIIVAIELKIIYDLPLLANMAWVALGEFVCVSVLGVIVVNALSKNKSFMKLIMAGSDQKQSD